MKRPVKILLWLLSLLLLALAVAVPLGLEFHHRKTDFIPAEREWLAAHANTLRLAPLPDAPPIDSFDEAGNPQGLTSDYVKLIEEQLGIRFQIIRCDTWTELLNKLKTREIDVVGSIQNTAERRKFLHFTKPYLKIPNVVLTRQDTRTSGPIEQDLASMRIAVVENSATHAHLKRTRPGYRLVPVRTAAKGFDMVAFRDVDAMIADLSVTSYYIEQRGIGNLRVAGEINYPWELCFASRKDWPALSSVLDKALGNISPRKHLSMRRKWITLKNTQIVPRSFYVRIVGPILLTTLLTIAGIMIWNRILKRQVTSHSEELGLVRKRHEQAAQALDLSEERFRVIVESSGDIIWEMDYLGNYIYVSPRVTEILGYTPRQLAGRSASSLMIASDAAIFIQRLRAATTKTTLNCETYTHLHQSGKTVILETSGIAFTNAAGKLAGFRGVSRNITHRVEADRARLASEERFRNLVETTSDWIWEVNTDGRFTYSSPQVNTILGFTPTELKGKLFTFSMLERDATIANEAFLETVQNGLPIQTLVSTNRHKTGQLISLETSAVPYYDENWNIMGYRGISRDITERKAAEKRIEFERNLFRSFMEHAPDLIYFKDREGRFIEVNASKANEQQCAPDEMLGKSDFDFLPETEARRKLEDEQRVMATEKPILIEESATTPSGTRWYLTTKVPRYDEDGKLVGTFGTSWDITDRKNAEDEARRLRALLRNIIDSMPSILVGVDGEGLVTQWNREAELATGIHELSALGQPLSTAFPRLGEEIESVRRAIQELEPQKRERIKRTTDEGQVRYSDITVYPLLGDATQSAVIREDDVTERVLIEESIRNIVEGASAVGRQFFRSMVVQLAKVLNADFTYIARYKDDSCQTLHTMAVSEQQTITDNFEFDLANTPSEQVLQQNCLTYISNAKETYPDSELLQSLQIDQYIGVPLVDSEERPLGVMVAMYRTAVLQPQFAASIMQVFAGRTAAELERLQANRELLGLRNLLGNIINSMPSILIGVDAAGTVVQWNLEAARTTGIDTSHAVGQRLERVFPILGDEMAKVLFAIDRRELHHAPRIHCTMHDSPHIVDVTVYPIQSEENEGAVIRVDDITERVRMQEAIMQSEKMMSVGGLAAGMAHEINNPLAGILQNMQVMHNRLTQDTPVNMGAAEEAGTTLKAIRTYMRSRNLLEIVESVIEAGGRAARIVDNMLSFSRKQEAKFKPYSLSDILERSVELASNDYNLKKKFDFRHIHIEREYDDSIDKVPCEKSQIQQVIMNLLSNSAQAMATQPDPERQPRITLRLIKEGQLARIDVEDNGPGMNIATSKRIFEPFFTTKDVGQGTGLGLSVSYFIITENHGGTMQVESTPGHGTRFSIRIPLNTRNFGPSQKKNSASRPRKENS